MAKKQRAPTPATIVCFSTIKIVTNDRGDSVYCWIQHDEPDPTQAGLAPVSWRGQVLGLGYLV
jgi:hypothetical protein